MSDRLVDLEAAALAYAVSKGYTPPAPAVTAYQWDASTAPVDPNSASLISAWLTYAFQHGEVFAAEVATAASTVNTMGYAIPATKTSTIDSQVYVPLGTQPGVSSDHALIVIDSVHGRETNLWQAKYDVTSKRISGCTAGSSMSLGTSAEPLPGSNAALIPPGRCIIYPAEIAAGSIPHPLVFSMANPGPAPNRYPATAAYGYSANTGFPLGTWLRLDPAVDVAALNLSHFETIVCLCLQRYGMFCTDQGSTLAIKLADPAGGMQSAKEWAAAGVTFNVTSGLPVAWALKASSSFPWPRMQVLQPPPKP